MKKLLILLFALVLFSLSACAQKQSVPTTTAAPTTSAPPTQPACVHEYVAADCDSPKTCALCGATRGSSLGHDYLEGICSRCGQADPTYLPLIGTQWVAVSLNETGSLLEDILLTFSDGTATVSAVRYARLADVPAADRTDAMLKEENWYDYSGEVYYHKESLKSQQLTCTVDGDLITCTLLQDGTAVATLILERTAGNMLSVTYAEGDFRVQFLAVGDVFSVEN